MSEQEILEEKERIYKKIEEEKKRLEAIREICEHREKYITNYSWRIGNVQEAELCKYCDKFIKFI